MYKLIKPVNLKKFKKIVLKMFGKNDHTISLLLLENMPMVRLFLFFLIQL